MPVLPDPLPTRAFVFFSELAEDVLGLFRARVYGSIQQGALPSLIYDIRSRRPIFESDLQRKALAVRQTGVGIDGSAVIFYRQDRQASTPTPLTRLSHFASLKNIFAPIFRDLARPARIGVPKSV